MRLPHKTAVANWFILKDFQKTSKEYIIINVTFILGQREMQQFDWITPFVFNLQQLPGGSFIFNLLQQQQQSQQPTTCSPQLFSGRRGVLLTALSLGCMEESVSPILTISTIKEPLCNRSVTEREESLPPKPCWTAKDRSGFVAVAGAGLYSFIFILYRRAVAKQLSTASLQH